MKFRLPGIFFSLLCFVFICLSSSCKVDVETDLTDQELYNMAQETDGFSWYKNSDTLFEKSIGSGHGQPFLRSRYNDIASAKLDAGGKVITGTKFPEGSLIVKELFENESTLGVYAILYKNSSHINADANGWVWGYIGADGEVWEPSSNKGISCNDCHSQPDNIDNTLMNKYFP